LFKRIYRHFVSGFTGKYDLKTISIQLVSLLVMGTLCFYGIRGRIARKSPIRVGTAFFSNYVFPNQLGLNPVYYFLRSSLDLKKQVRQEVHLMPDDEAIRDVRSFYCISDSLSSPLARNVIPEGNVKPYHVVLILMEGMSADLLQRQGYEHSRWHFLDSLSYQSLYFDNCYSAGIHTMNGVFGSLFSYPALFNQHPMKNAEIRLYDGFPSELRKQGYQTVYFTTHDDQFDNIGGFLKMNEMELIVSQKDYPRGKVLSNLGVPDDYMFEQAIPVLDRLANNRRPFFATFLTASHHSPMIVPEYYRAAAGDIKEQIHEYCDWSLKKFFQSAQSKEWYEQTIFVLTGDHGVMVGDQIYDISLSRHHCPLLIIAPDRKPETIQAVASQLDIYPTVMGLLNIPYINTTLGVDLLHEGRKYAVLNSDDVVACVGDSLMYIYHTQGRTGLYRYKTKNTENLMSIYPTIADSMRMYLFSTMQAAQYCIQENLTGTGRLQDAGK
jgi:phosphoglycerol transferase MdoB-like AlkP superfamily enzyme